MRAYSMDLRERIVAAVDAGLTQGQAAERFEVSLRTVERYVARRRVTGSLAATEQRHGPEPTVRRRLQAWLPGRLATVADATLAEHVAAFVADGGARVSLSAIPDRHRARRDRARGVADPDGQGRPQPAGVRR